jgi:hypothetical protein
MIVHRRSDHHAIVPIDCLEDQRLSWTARGVVACLVAFSDGVEALLVHRAHASADERQEIEEALRELEAAGYIEFNEQAAS